ncbi:MAG: cation-translocating P-type ATPase [Verrucomicrobia bacterium]|nr:cation-translocating P-type ATPase [Verrucomicrobiota bacterium]
MISPFWTQSVSEISAHLNADLKAGLTQDEAKRRLERLGPNALPKNGGVIWWKLLFEQFSSIIVWLLIGAAIVAGLLGEVIDAWAILAIVILNAALGFFQEYRAERSLEALQQLAAPMSKVLRDGILQLIPSEQVVAGDVVLLEAGDRVPADGRVVTTAYLATDESSLTGESLPVAKTDQILPGERLLADRKNMVFMGTTVTTGKGHVLIVQTGLETEIGKIASELLVAKKETTPLQKRLDHFGKRMVYFCLAIVAIVFLVGILRGIPIVDMLLISLSLAVAAIPEGLPAAVTIALSIGVRKMAKKNGLIRRLSSVETLGSANIIFTDKTGTLTQNEMTVRSVWVDRKFIAVTGSGYAPIGKFEGEAKDLEWALTIGVLCNNANVLQKEGKWIVAGDPTEGALLTAAKKFGINPHWQFCEEIPFDSDRKMMSVLREKGGEKLWFVKGAPDVLIQKSKKWLIDGQQVPLTDPSEILRANQELASKAYRVLGVAFGPSEEELTFVALVAMIDPPRPEAKEAILRCKEAGVRTVMVTGDHKGTAQAIARELEMDQGRVVDGTQLDQMRDDELHDVVVFSRITAAHKLRIVNAYSHVVTAMTGDGVNDAPAIHAADIGIAMGITGTEVTKQSADLIILDDNFASIAHAIEQGRGIYDNIVKFVSYLLSSNIAEILVIFIIMLIGLKISSGEPFVALLPVQLLWMNLVTDGFPAISLALDPIAPRAMKRPPRPRSEPILTRHFSLFLLAMSLMVTAGAIGACFYGYQTSVVQAQTMTFTTLIVLELVKVHMIRSQYRMKLFSNPYVILAIASSLILQLLVLYVPSLRIIFSTVPLTLADWGVILGIATATWIAGKGITKIFLRDKF